MSKENRAAELLTRITSTKVWQVGVEGILEDQVTKHMDNEKLAKATKWVIRVGAATSLALSAWACKNGWIPIDLTPSPTTSTETVPPIETEIAQGTLNEVVDKAERTAIIDSLPEDRPEAKYGSEGMDVFTIDTESTSSKFAMYELSDEEVKNGIAVMLDEQILVQNVALYTERKDSEGNTSWVRLIAVTVPSNENGVEKNIVWVYDENGFPTQGDQKVSLDRPVLSYPIPNNTDRVLFSPLLPADPSPIIGWDGFNPFYVNIQGNTPGSFKVNANTTQIEVPTPEVTSKPEYPAIPQEIIDKLPPKWEVVQTAGTWYIVDSANQTNIFRFPESAEKWQERHDVTVGETTYEGWVTDEGSMEVSLVNKAGMEYNSVDNLQRGISALNMGWGYLKEYQNVEITDGQEKMDVLFFTMQYLLNNNEVLTINYRADKKFLGRGGFDAKKSLGQLFNITILIPTNRVAFSDELMKDVVEAYKFNKLQQKFYQAGHWIDLGDVLNKLNNPPSDYLDLTVGSVVSLATPRP